MINYILEQIDVIFISSLIIYKIIECILRNMYIRDYNFIGDDLGQNHVKVEWLYNYTDIKPKYSNDYFYFMVYTQLRKEDGVLNSIVEIDNKCRLSYDRNTIILVSKKNISFIDLLRLLLWFIYEYIIFRLNIINYKKYKKLPKFFVDKYVFSDNVYLNNINKV